MKIAKQLIGKQIEDVHYAKDGFIIKAIEIRFTDGTCLRIDEHRDVKLWIGLFDEEENLRALNDERV